MDLLSLSAEQAWGRLKADLGALVLMLQAAKPQDSDCLLASFQNHLGLFFQKVLLNLEQGKTLDPNPGFSNSKDYPLAVASERLASLSGKISPITAWIGALFSDSRPFCLGESSQNISGLVRDWNLPVWVRLCGRLHEPGGMEASFQAGLNRNLGLVIVLAKERQNCTQGPLSALGKQCAKELGIDESQIPLAGAIPGPASEKEKPLGSNMETLVGELIRAHHGEGAQRQQAARSLDQEELGRYRLALQNRITEEASRLLEMKLKAMAEFAAGAGHEINNPLAVIQGHAQFLLGRLEDLELADFHDKLAPSLESIVRQAKRIHGILRQLMTYARPALPEPTPFEPLELLKGAAFRMEDWALEKRVSLELQLENASHMVLADPGQIKTVIECLVQNGIEAAAPDGWVKLSTRLNKDEFVHITVQDSGPGPGPEDLQHLFDPFYSGRAAGRGKGLGLSIAWKLAALNKGRIEFTLPSANSPNTFSLVIPQWVQEKTTCTGESPSQAA